MLSYDSMKNKQRFYGEQAGSYRGCGAHFESRNLEVDNILAKASGGTDHLDNLQLLCGSCNRIKGNRGEGYSISRLSEGGANIRWGAKAA